MLFEFVYPSRKEKNGFSSYVESLAPEQGLELIEQCSTATVIEGEWDQAMNFLRRCQEYLQEHELGPETMTTIHVHS